MAGACSACGWVSACNTGSWRRSTCAKADPDPPRMAASMRASPERRRLLGPHLDVTQGFGDFLRLRLEIFSEHIEASSDDTGDHPQNHQESKECRHRGARVLSILVVSPSSVFLVPNGALL